MTTPVPSDDPEMLEAIARARRSVKDFFDAFTKPRRGQTSFLWKIAFSDGGRVEHIWLADLDFSGPKPRGVVANEPSLPGFQFKQSIEFDASYLSDWMYVDDGKLVGGFTTRLLRQRMTPEERRSLDDRVPYTF